MDELTPNVDALRIVRRKSDRKRPVPTIFDVRRCPTVRGFRPNTDVSDLSGLEIETLEPAVIAARPHDIVVFGIKDNVVNPIIATTKIVDARYAEWCSCFFIALSPLLRSTKRFRELSLSKTGEMLARRSSVVAHSIHIHLNFRLSPNKDIPLSI
jgi:hypothetical protein